MPERFEAFEDVFDRVIGRIAAQPAEVDALAHQIFEGKGARRASRFAVRLDRQALARFAAGLYLERNGRRDRDGQRQSPKHTPRNPRLAFA